MGGILFSFVFIVHAAGSLIAKYYCISDRTYEILHKHLHYLVYSYLFCHFYSKNVLSLITIFH